MDNDRDPLDDRRWRAALYSLAVIGTIDLVQLVALVALLLARR
jgi:hypothetical protein